jgi:hyperosmotically inducible protein
MHKPHLLSIALAIVTTLGAACNRTDTSREAREAAADVKAAASRAGEKLADSWLTTKVQAQYFADDDIKSRYINVSSLDGTVTLKGFVESEDVRQQALQIARNTDGVRQINDQLLIGQPPARFETAPVATTGADATEVTPQPEAGGAAAPLTDAMIASRIQSQYFLDSMVKARAIDVASANGVVTLRGQVASDAERAQALRIARTTEGVQRVEDSLTVDASLAAPLPSRSNAVPDPLTVAPGAVGTGGPRAEDTTLEGAVRQKLAGDSQLTAVKVDVSARDGVVLVEGTVPTTAIKERVLSAVRGTSGVIQVVDRMTVTPARRK